MKPATTALLAFTVAMVAVHLTSGRLLRRAWRAEAPGWISVLNIFRFEGIYYVALMAYVAWHRVRFLLAPLILMAVLHLGGWLLAESRRDWLVNTGNEGARERILSRVRAFDLAETVVLFYITWVLARALFIAA